MVTETATPRSSSTFLTPYEQERIQYRVNRLARAFGLNHHDINDLRSEFTTELLRGLRRFDPQRASRRTYSDRILSKAYLNIARRLGVSARRAERIGTPPHAKEGLPDWRPEADRRIDVEGALKRLPRKLRVIAEELKEYEPAEVAQRLNIHRSTVYRRIPQIRAYLVAAGLDDTI